MYVERLASGQWGVYLDNGKRIAIRHTEPEAKRHMKKLRSRKQ